MDLPGAPPPQMAQAVFAHQAVKDLEPQHHPTPTNLYHVSAHVPKRERVLKQDYPVTTSIN